jgi:hypothetical protein
MGNPLSITMRERERERMTKKLGKIIVTKKALLKRIIFIMLNYFLQKIIPLSFSMSIFKTFLFLPFLSRFLLKSSFRNLKWGYLTFQWNFGLPYFEIELVNLRISEMESKMPQI